MKPLKSPPARQLADLRVTRKTNVGLVHKGEGHGWAVSYADLLMVLLSFFVLYFNFNEGESGSRDDQFRQLALSFKGVAEEGPNTMPGNSRELASYASQNSSEAYASLSEHLKIEGATVVQAPDKLVIDFENVTFKSASYQMNSELKTSVDEVIKRLQPYKEAIEITVIGHADDRILIPRNEFLKDNFDLSSLRALSVLKYMRAEGFPDNKASARAASSFDRNARSISLEIRISKPQKKGASS